MSPNADELDDELRESDFERCWIPKGIARVKYQRLDEKEKDIRKTKRKREREHVRKGGVQRGRGGHTSIPIRDIFHSSGIAKQLLFRGNHRSVKINKIIK